MKKTVLALAFAGSILATPAIGATYTVGANSPGTSLGNVVSNKKYRITATGIVDLVGDQIPGGSFNLDANGVPQPEVTDPNYPYFNPGGSTTADGQSGPLPGANFGALIGSVGGASPYFLIGKSFVGTFDQSGELFARINDINTNNSGSFQVSIAAIPEPATWGMMMLGFGAMGFAMRRRAKVRTTVAFG